MDHLFRKPQIDLKQQTDRDLRLRKQNFTMQVDTPHKTAILVKSGHILQRKYPLIFPLMFYDCSASTL